MHIHAHVGWSGYVFTEYPLIAYISLFSISASIYFIIFAVYWAGKGFRLMTAESLKEEQGNPRPDRPARRQERRNVVTHPSVDEPPPDIWNRDELPECPQLDDIPGWNVAPKADHDLNRGNRPDVVSSVPPNRRIRDEVFPRSTGQVNGSSGSLLHRRPAAARKTHS